MRKPSLLAAIWILLLSALAGAQATRTWVSGVGDDANPCSRTAPCKTFAGAISKTATGGEIDALDPGGFGALTITKSITLDGGGGQVASVLVAGTNGIVVAAGTSDEVIIRNLRFDGLLGNGTNSGNAGLNGIRFISGADLNIENCVIFGFNTNAIDLEPSNAATVHIVNTITKNNGSCVSCTSGTGDGVFAKDSGGRLKVAIDDSQIMLSANNGVEASDNARITVNRSLISASAGSGATVDSAGGVGSPLISIDYSDVVNGNNGVSATATGNFVLVAHTTITGNTGTAYNPSGGGLVAAYATGAPAGSNGTNRVHDNGSQGTAVYINEN